MMNEMCEYWGVCPSVNHFKDNCSLESDFYIKECIAWNMFYNAVSPIMDKINKMETNEHIPCYHKWRYFNHWCNVCGEFTPNDRDHGVMVHHCFRCDRLWDEEDGWWTQEDINNVFFNEFYKGND